MADFIKQVMTSGGPKQIDYTALANLPTIDAQVISGSTRAVQGRAVFNELKTVKEDIESLEDKFNVNGQALDSAKFGGYLPSHYVSQADLQQFSDDLGLGDIESNVGDNASAIQSLGTILNNKLDKDAKAADSAKLNGQAASYYATASAVSTAQQSANDAQTTATGAMSLAQTAKDTADLALPKASFVFNSSTGTLDITL